MLVYQRVPKRKHIPCFFLFKKTYGPYRKFVPMDPMDRGDGSSKVQTYKPQEIENFLVFFRIYQGLVLSHFGNIGYHLIVAIIDHIPNFDVQWGHLMTIHLVN